MSKKSKKIKKPKPLDIQILSATDIEFYINSKFEISNDEFWAWFFGECPWGETTLLALHEDDVREYADEYRDYIRLIREEFQEYADEELCLEITNDF